MLKLKWRLTIWYAKGFYITWHNKNGDICRSWKWTKNMLYEMYMTYGEYICHQVCIT